MDFSEALSEVKRGQRVTRRGWNGPGQYVYYVKESTFTVNRPPLLGILKEGTTVKYNAHLDMRNAQGEFVPWLASQGDLLAEDWAIVT